MATSLLGRDILDVQSLSNEEVKLIMDTAARFERVMDNGGRLMNMYGKTLATLFFEPSTRTRLSFETAMLRLGGSVISVADGGGSSSAKKGETVYDTGKMIEAYADVAVIRHPVTGSAAELAATAATAPASTRLRRCSTCTPSSRKKATLKARPSASRAT